MFQIRNASPLEGRNMGKKRMAALTADALGILMVAPASAMAGTLTVDPTSYDFGTVPRGDTPGVWLTITNTGSNGETIGNVYLDGPDFELSQNSCSAHDLAPAATCGVAVQVSSSAVLGQDGSTLTVDWTDDSDPNSITQATHATLTATVTPPPPPPLQVVSTGLSRSSFYPLVQDGYQDRVSYSYRLNEAATGCVQLLSRTGRVVNRWRITSRKSGTVTWSGRTSDGRKVAPGTYRFRVRATANGRTVTSATHGVRVRTGYRIHIRRGTVAKSGVRSITRSSHADRLGGNCNWSGYMGELLSSCLFAHASVSYRLAVPAGATVTATTHRVGAGLMPCRGARWQVTHLRRGVALTFTHGSARGFSQCWVKAVSVSWRHRTRVRI